TFGTRSGSHSFNQSDPKTIEAAVRKSEELARLAPEDPEYMPPPRTAELPSDRGIRRIDCSDESGRSGEDCQGVYRSCVPKEADIGRIHRERRTMFNVCEQQGIDGISEEHVNDLLRYRPDG